MKPKPKLDMAALLIESLEQVIDGLNGGPTKLTVRTIDIPDPPHIAPKAIRALRETLCISQAVFAKLVGVSPKLVEAWERGSRVPSTTALRLLDAIARNPKFYVRRTTRRTTGKKLAKS